MNKKIITAIIALTFLIESPGVEGRPFIAQAKGQTLRPMAAAVSDNVKRIKLEEELDFETEKLPPALMAKLPGLKKNERFIAIREERGLSQAQARKMAGNIPSSTFSHLEGTDTIPSPKHLYEISRALKIDPILIIDGEEWDKAKKKLKDQERIYRLRLRKGRTQLGIVEVLKEAGLVFATDNLDAQRTTYSNWETKKAKPLYGDKIIIAKVLGDDTLFDIPGQFKGDIELKIMPGVPIRSKIGFGLAFYWKEIRGCSTLRVGQILGVTSSAVRYFINQYGVKKVTEFYQIRFAEKRKRLQREKPLAEARIPSEEKELPAAKPPKEEVLAVTRPAKEEEALAKPKPPKMKKAPTIRKKAPKPPKAKEEERPLSNTELSDFYLLYLDAKGLVDELASREKKPSPYEQVAIEEVLEELAPLRDGPGLLNRVEALLVDLGFLEKGELNDIIAGLERLQKGWSSPDGLPDPMQAQRTEKRLSGSA